MEAALSHVVRNKVEAAYARSDLFPNRVGKQLEEKQLRLLLQRLEIAAVPHGFLSSFRDWEEETDHPISTIALHRRNSNTYSVLQML